MLEEAPTLVGLDRDAQQSEVKRILRRQRNPALEDRLPDEVIPRKAEQLVKLAEAMDDAKHPILKEEQELSVELHSDSRRYGLVEVLGWLLVMLFLTRPACVIFVYTTRTNTIYKYQKKVLEKRNIKVYGIQTDPYDIAAIVRAIDERLAEIAKQSDVIAQSLKSLVFNLTGGTKIMSLAAYQVAERLQAPVIYFQSEKGKSIVDYYSWQDHQLSRQQQEELPEYLHLEDVLELHLGPRKDPNGGEMWNVKRPARLSGDGHKLELAIAQVLNDHGYEALCGVGDRSGSLDIDVMIRYHNRIGIIEVKASGKGVVEDFEAIQQLSATKNFLRGTYTQPFMVINSKSTTNQEMVCKLLGIRIISLPYYRRGTSTLSPEEINILLPAIDEVMKVETPKS